MRARNIQGLQVVFIQRGGNARLFPQVIAPGQQTRGLRKRFGGEGIVLRGKFGFVRG